MAKIGKKSLPPASEMFRIWDDGEDPEKHALARQILEVFQARHGGKIKVDPDDDEVFQLRFVHQGRPTRILLDASFSGDVELEARFENRRGVLTLDWDEEYASRPVEGLPIQPSGADAGDPWAAEDAESRTFHLGRGVYVSEFAGQAAGMLKVVEELPPVDRDLLLGGMADLRLDQFCFDDEEATLELYDELQELAEKGIDPIERIDGMLGLLAWGLEVFGQGSAKVEPRVRVMIGGQPMPGGLDVRACPACRKVVNLAGGPHCPQCGERVNG